MAYHLKTYNMNDNILQFTHFLKKNKYLFYIY